MASISGIKGKPYILGKPEHRVYPDIPRSKSGTRKYLIDYFNTSTQPKPASYFFQNPTGTRPILKTTYPLGSGHEVIVVFGDKNGSNYNM